MTYDKPKGDRLSRAASFLRTSGLRDADVAERCQIDWEVQVRFGLQLDRVLRDVARRCDGARTLRRLRLQR